MRDDGVSPDPVAVGRRALKNLALEYLVASAIRGDRAGSPAAGEFDNLTTLRSARHAGEQPSPAKAGCCCGSRASGAASLADEQVVQHPGHAVGQPGEPPVLERVRALLRHSAYSEQDPQGQGAGGGVLHRQPSGVSSARRSGYAFWLEQVARIDAFNPIVARALRAP